MFHQLRTASDAMGNTLGDAVARSLAETHGFSVEGMRSSGFRAMEQMLASLSGPELRTAAPLMDKANVDIDKAVVRVGLQRLTVVADLLADGLVYKLTDALSVTQVEHTTQSKVGAAQRTMSPSARGENKLPILLPTRTPVYLTTDTFQIDIRTLGASRRGGVPLDMAMVEGCTRSVNEAIEDSAINGPTTLDGSALVVSGYSCYGLLNAPNANTATGTLADWTTAPNGGNVQAKVLTMAGQLQADLKFGPYNLYVGTVIGNSLNTDFKANGNDSILQRLQEMSFGGRNLRVRVADMVPAGYAILVQMTSDVIDVIDGQRPTVIPWTSLDGMTIHSLVMGIMIPRVRSDYNGNSGVCILTLT